jgi:hypothetical protein
VRGLFQGVTATAARDAPYAGMYLVCYEKGKEVACEYRKRELFLLLMLGMCRVRGISPYNFVWARTDLWDRFLEAETTFYYDSS